MLKRPIISEKSMKLAKEGLYTFEVGSDLNKQQIAKIVAAKFNVDVVFVKTINITGKRKVQRTRRGHYFQPDIKKALVRVKNGQKIALFETAQNEEEEGKEKVTVRTAEGEQVAVVKEKKSLLRGTKVKVEKVQDKEKIAKENDPKRPTKQSQKERKKGEKKS